MKTLLVISALLAAGASAPALAQDQGDPNPPAVTEPGPKSVPSLAEAETPAMRDDLPMNTGLASGDTSGPAAGSDVQPPTVVQKQNPLAEANASPSGAAGPSGMAAGSPGVEGAPGTQAGREWLPPEEIQRKKPSM